MRATRWFGHTLRQEPEGLAHPGLAALLRGGYLWRADGAAWALSPLGVRLLERVEALWPSEPVAALTVQVPWGGTAFWARPVWGGPARALPSGWQEVLRGQVRSYRDLPRLLRGRAASWLLWLAAAEEDAPPWAIWEAFWARLGLSIQTLAGHAGVRVWGVVAPWGTHTALRCPACGYAALQPWAQRAKPHPPAEPPQPLQVVATPGAHTIRDLTAQLGVPATRTAKAVFLTAETGDLVFAVVRGDMEVSVPKVAAALGVSALRPATEAEIRAVGAEPGYASPIGVQGAQVVVDDLLPHAPNLVAGANRPDTHFTGVNYGRDYTAHVVADIVQTAEGDPCPRCGASLRSQRVWPLAQGDVLRPDPAVTFPGPEGRARPLLWAVARWDPVAVLAALAATYRTAQGVAWPGNLAPWPVTLLSLRGGEAVAEAVYRALQAAGLAVFWDDRDASPGVKFADADWLGSPVRLVVSRRSLAQGGVEVRRATARTGEWVPPERVVAAVRARLEEVGA